MRSQLFEQPDFLLPVDDLSHLRGTRVAMTGSSGVLGTILSNRFKASGIPFETLRGDITVRPEVKTFIETSEPDVLFHLAAIVPTADVSARPARAFDVNVMGTLNVAMSLVESRRPGWLFFASSSHVYSPPEGDDADQPLDENAPTAPVSLYGRTKLAAERGLMTLLNDTAHVGYCIGRIFSFSHTTQRPPFLVPSLQDGIDSAREGGSLRIRNGSSVRDMMDAESVADALLHLANRRYKGVVNIGSGRGHTIAEIARKLIMDSGRNLLVDAEDLERTALVADVTRLQAVLTGTS